MTYLLKIDSDGNIDLVSNDKRSIGDNVDVIEGVTGRRITGIVNEILEQRKERGIYQDEKNRRIWQKVKLNK